MTDAGAAQTASLAILTRINPPESKLAATHSAVGFLASMIAIASQILINMVAVTAVSGAVLLTLLAAKHF